MTGPLAVGVPAPEFMLRDQNNQVVTLSALRSQRAVLVVFFPLAFTGTCESELGYIRDHLPQFDNEAVTTVAISVGPPPTHKVWSGAQGFLFPIVADFWPHGAVAAEYGVFDQTRGIPNRGTFVIDTDGQIVFSDMIGPGQARTEDTWEAALATVGALS